MRVCPSSTDVSTVMSVTGASVISDGHKTSSFLDITGRSGKISYRTKDL